MSLIYVFGLLVVVPLILNGIASRFDFKGFVDAFGISVMIVIIWSITNILALVFEPPLSKALHWLIDFVALSVCIISWRTQREAWKLVLAGLYLAQLCLHALFWVEWQTQPHGNMLYNYLLWLNVIWLVQLATVAWPGGRCVVGRIVAWGADSWSHHHRAGSAR